MAPTESADQSSSALKSAEGDGKPEEAEPETAQEHSVDPPVTKILRFTVSGSDQLSDPAMEEAFRAASELGLDVADVSDTFDTYGDKASDVKSSAPSADSTSADVSGTAGAEEEERKSSSNTPTKFKGIPLTEKRCIRPTIAQALVEVFNALVPMPDRIERVECGFGALLCLTRVRLWIV